LITALHPTKPRLLWLGFERPPHPDAVCHAATTADVEFVLEWLEQPHTERSRIASQLQNFVRQQEALNLWHRPALPCRRPAGLYILIPWRFAKWLACILPAEAAVLERTRQQLETWLTNGGLHVVRPK